jgi:hypothetical protein
VQRVQTVSAASARTESKVELAARLGPSGMRLFFNLAKLWRLSVSEQQTLLALPRSTLAQYRRHPDSVRLELETLERLSCLLGIYKALQILVPDTAQADEWVRRPNSNPLFNGRTALDRMLSGRVADLYVVRRYLDGQRG